MDHLIGVPGRGARTARSVRLSGAYDPDQPSDGLTLDTPLGPVDLVAVDRILSGRAVPLTPADRAYVLGRVRPDYPSLTAAAMALGITRDSVARAVDRARVRLGAAA